jgi:hypothetical protein
MRRDISLGMKMTCGLVGEVSIPDRAKIFFSSPQRPDQL